MGANLGVLSLVRFSSSDTEDWKLGKAASAGIGANATLGFNDCAMAFLSSSVMVSGTSRETDIE